MLPPVLHVPDHCPCPRSPAGAASGHSSIHPLSASRPNPSTLPSWVSTSVRQMVLVLAAGLSGPAIPASSGPGPAVQRRWYPRSLPDDCTPTARLKKAHQSVLHVTTAPTLLQTLIRRLRQSQRRDRPTVRRLRYIVAPSGPYTAKRSLAGGWCFHPASRVGTLSRSQRRTQSPLCSAMRLHHRRCFTASCS